MFTNYTTHLVADTANGVQKADPIDYPEADWELSLEDFLNRLKSLDEGEQAFFAADPEQLEIIENEYGIR